MNAVRVESSRRGNQARGRRNWKVIDDKGPKAFRRVFVYSCWDFAVFNAHRIARSEPIYPHGLLSVLVERHHGNP